MRLVPVLYHGFTAMDRRFSVPMLPWIVSEIRKRDSYERLSLGVEDGHLQGYNSDFEIQFSHKLGQMTRFSQADSDPCTFLYLLRDDGQRLLFCYLFQASKCSDVLDLYQQMKDNAASSNLAPAKYPNGAANLTSLCGDISPSSSNFFEVLYIGKIKLWNKKVPESFIDDALEKFKAHDREKARRKLEQLKSESSARRGSVDLQAFHKPNTRPHLQRSHSVISDIGIKSPEVDRKDLGVNTRLNDDENANEETTQDDVKDEGSPFPVETDDHNRTMVLQIDRTDLRLISPDRKVILLQKHYRDVSTCIRGIKNSEHFGFVCKEGGNVGTFIGYVFKCESHAVATEAVGAITQSFNSAETKYRSTITSCEHCPMLWFHKLCCEIESLSDKKTQAAIIRRIEQLDEGEQTTILTKYHGVETDSIRDGNELLMMLLRAHCEAKQGRHVHDTAENRSEFLNQYLGGGNTIFMKAKRSLTTSFDNLLKRRASKDDFNVSGKEMTLPINSSRKESDASDIEGIKSAVDPSENYLNINRSPDKNGNVADKNLKSPMMDIFLKVGSPKSSEESSPSKHEARSYRQAIFKRVITPSKPQRVNRRRTKEELRTLWKNSIHQAILLIRMEKENARLRARQEEKAVKRIKLEYDELKTCSNEEFFEQLLGDEADRISRDEILEAVKGGVPRAKRGEVWNRLSDRFAKDSPPIDPNRFPNFYVPYESLLKQLTSHQHVILIDLGRTYPSHPYYRSPLGPGQLALFNLLKAYSLLDPEVGYCQGLSFVAGVLLLHMEESQAFALLRHLMFHRDLRKQYLPDMVGLQVRLYQLSRLLHDRLPELYEHFDVHEVAPTLYAAPWLLTVFASQFPLGFVARVFDLMFLDGSEVAFRVAAALLTHYKEELLARESFEDIMCFLKNRLPGMGAGVLDRIVTEVYTMDISKQLNEYQVEYQVLQEEMQSVQPQVENLHRLELLSKSLTEQNKALTNQMEALNTNVQRLEQNRAVQQSQITHLKAQNRGLEVTLSTLASFINDLAEDKVDVEIPGEVRRILSQMTIAERRRSETKNNFLNAVFKKSENSRALVKSLSTGKIAEGSVRTNGFFSKSYGHILQRQRTLSESDETEKAAELPIEPAAVSEKSSPTNSIDSGVGTPGSPREEKHPLSSCDVRFTYNGTKELRRLGGGPQRNRSLDDDGK